MVDMTFWELWRNSGPFSKFLLIYIAALFLVAGVKAIRRVRADSESWIEWSSWVQRSATSASMVCLFVTVWRSARIVNGETIADETKIPLSYLIRQDLIIHLKQMSMATGLVLMLLLIGWIVRTIATRSKASPVDI